MPALGVWETAELWRDGMPFGGFFKSQFRRTFLVIKTLGVQEEKSWRPLEWFSSYHFLKSSSLLGQALKTPLDEAPRGYSFFQSSSCEQQNTTSMKCKSSSHSLPLQCSEQLQVCWDSAVLSLLPLYLKLKASFPNTSPLKKKKSMTCLFLLPLLFIFKPTPSLWSQQKWQKICCHIGGAMST